MAISPILVGRTFALVWWQLNLSILPFQFQQWICCRCLQAKLGIFFISPCLSNVSSLLGMSMACFKASLFLSMRGCMDYGEVQLDFMITLEQCSLGFKTTTIQFLDVWIHKRGITSDICGQKFHASHKIQCHPWMNEGTNVFWKVLECQKTTWVGMLRDWMKQYLHWLTLRIPPRNQVYVWLHIAKQFHTHGRIRSPRHGWITNSGPCKSY